MDNRSYRSQYIEEITQGLNEKPASEIINIWRKIGLFEKQIGCYLEDGFSKEQYIQLFEYQSVVSPNSFYVRKSGIASYLKWLVSNGFSDSGLLSTLQAISFSDIKPDSIFENRYYKCFDDLQSEIETTVYFADRHDDSVFDLQIAALYLAWCGFTIEEAILLKKEDIKDYYILKDGKKIRPENTIMDHLVKYRDAVSYEHRGKGIITRKYSASEFLLRTASAYRVETPRVLRVFINQFGLSGNGSNPFNYNKIHRSGIFNRAFEYECENTPLTLSDVDIMASIFQENFTSREAAYKRLTEYQKYRDYFYPNY